LTALAAAPPADAAPRQAQAQARPERTTEAAAPRNAGEPIMAVVSIKSQKVTFYDADGWILRAPVSTGTTGRETPAGIFSVVQKDKDHHSSLYDDAWMPNMLRITWNGNRAARRAAARICGLARLRADALRLCGEAVDKVPIGTRVIISPNDAEPVEFSHPVLFAPKSEAIAAAPARAEALTREADEATKLAQQTKTAAALAVKEAGPLAAALRKLELAKTRADAALAAAEKAVATAKDRAGQGTRREPVAKSRCESRGTADATRRRQGEIEARRRRSDQGRRQGGRDQEGRGRRGGKPGKAGARAGLGLHQPRDAEALCAAQHAQTASGRGRVLRFDHRGAGHDPQSDKPIGTHVFSPWRAKTGACAGPRSRSMPATTPRDALDRITIPQEVLDRIAPTASPRSSLVISDEPLHKETNYRTEFIVALNNQPQGGILTRTATRSPEARVGFFGGLAFRRDARARQPAEQPRLLSALGGWW